MSQIIAAYRHDVEPGGRAIYDLNRWRSTLAAEPEPRNRMIRTSRVMVAVPDGWSVMTVSNPGTPRLDRLVDDVGGWYSLAEALALGLATVLPDAEEGRP